MTDRIPTWKQGKKAQYANYAEAAKDTDLNWEPTLIPVPIPSEDADLTGLEFGGESITMECYPSSEWNMIMRSDTHEMLGVAKSTYYPLSNEAVGELADRINSRYGFEWDSITTFKNGSVIVYTLAWPDGGWVVRGDHSKQLPYINLINSHDGRTAFTVVPSAIRPSCANVIRPWRDMARRLALGLSMRHTKRIIDTPYVSDQVFRLVEEGMGQLKQLENLTQQLAQANDISTNEFVRRWLPMPNLSDKPTDDEMDTYRRKVTRVEKAREKFNQVFNSETDPGSRSNPYALWQAAIEVDQHLFTTHGQEQRMRRNLMGGSEKSQAALQIAAEMAGIKI